MGALGSFDVSILTHALMQAWAAAHEVDKGSPHLGVKGLPAAQHVQDLPLRHFQQRARDLSRQLLRVLVLKELKQVSACSIAWRDSLPLPTC